MDLQLNGKLALVTGSTAGIGLAIGSTLAGEGATVAINGRSESDSLGEVDVPADKLWGAPLFAKSIERHALRRKASLDS